MPEGFFEVTYNERPCFFKDALGPKDYIANFHRNGKFYENDELELLAKLFPAGGIFVDVGCNVGNHTLFVLQHMAASKVFAFEPNPTALAILKENIKANGFTRKVKLHPIGLGEVVTDTAGIKARRNNLGGARISETGSIKIRRGDDVLNEADIDLLKIDVEGMEISVLRGLMNTVKRTQPVIFVECLNRREARLQGWMSRMNYKALKVLEPGGPLKNYLICPEGRFEEFRSVIQ